MNEESNEEGRSNIIQSVSEATSLPPGINPEAVNDIHKNRARVMKKIGDILSGNAVQKKAKPIFFSMYTAPQESKHEIGEMWVDADGNEWEQCDGYKMKVPRLDIEDIKKYRMPYDCPKCNKSFVHWLDKKMWYIHGVCNDCVQEFETELRATGKYKEYERQKIMANIRAFYLDVMNGLGDYINSFDATYVSSDGEVERWDKADKEMIKSMVLIDLTKLKESFEKEFGEPLEKSNGTERKVGENG